MSYKVCYVTTLPGTLESFCLKSALYNIEHGGWNVTFICDKDESFAERLPAEIRYIPVDMPRGMNLAGFHAIPQLVRIFKKEKFDLVQYATANAGLYSSIAAKIAKVPIRIYTMWGLGYVQLKGFRHLYKEAIEKIICANSTHIQPDSKENLQIAIEQKLFAPEQGTVIGDGSAIGVDFERFDINKKQQWGKEISEKYDIPQDAFVLGYVGMMLRDKGINELLDAAKLLITEYDRFYLLLIGGTDVKEGIDEDKWLWAKNEDRVIIAGRQNEVEKYYAAMDCFTLPSYHEGFGMVTIEAEAMGVPVIDTDIPGSREAMKDGLTGISIPVKDAQALYHAVKRLYLDTSLKEQYGNAGFKYAKEKFDQRTLIHKIYENRAELLKHE